MRTHKLIVALMVFAIAAYGLAFAAENVNKEGYKDTPMEPNAPWHVHDPDRPSPPTVTPATPSTQEAPGQPPSDAVVLFDGKDLSKWTTERGQPAGWPIKDGVMTVLSAGRRGAANPGGGSIITKDRFGDCQLHVEWRTPPATNATGQGRGNSGIIFAFNYGKNQYYEIQVLDNYNNPTYADGWAGGIYAQRPPLVNATKKPGEWQYYDIIFTCPKFDKDNKLVTPAYFTVILNGLVTQNHTEVIGSTLYRTLPAYVTNPPHPSTFQLYLQDHGGNQISYRNIWIRELKNIEDKAAAPQAAAAAVKSANDPAGVWKWSRANQAGTTMESTLKIKTVDGKLSGTLTSTRGATDIADAKVANDELTFSITRDFNGTTMTSKYAGKISGDDITGTIQSGSGDQARSRDWTAKREKDAAK